MDVARNNMKLAENERCFDPTCHYNKMDIKKETSHPHQLIRGPQHGGALKENQITLEQETGMGARDGEKPV